MLDFGEALLSDTVDLVIPCVDTGDAAHLDVLAATQSRATLLVVAAVARACFGMVIRSSSIIMLSTIGTTDRWQCRRVRSRPNIGHSQPISIEINAGMRWQ